MLKLSHFRSLVGILPYLYNYLHSAQQKYTNPNYRLTEKRKIAIYCIHGTGDKYNAFTKSAKYIQPKLPECYSCIHLVEFSGSFRRLKIEDFANQLINQILDNEDTDVILIGHSSGGLIATYAAESLAKQNNITVRMVVAISSPYRGSWWAKMPVLRQFPGFQQMQTDHPFLIKLSKRFCQSDERTKVAHHIFIRAKRDKIVRGESFLPYGYRSEENVYQFSYDGHLSILLNTILYDIILNHLRYTASACDTPLHQTELIDL